MDTKLVSAIITTHNRVQLLQRAIESVLTQTYKNIECIVVDDSSTDDTKALCGKYPIHYIYIPKEESRGGNYARNLGIKASIGEYCAFLDDDDYWLPTKIEKQVALIEKMDCELVYCGRRVEYVRNDQTEFKDTIPNSTWSGDMHKKILYKICTTTTNILVKRQALFDVGLFDENLSFWQEYELTIRLAQRKAFYFVNEPLSVYRVDTRDSQRLTNKYFEWRIAVSYIHHKHRSLYNQLSLIEKYLVQNLVWNDAKIRSKNSGLVIRYSFYTLLTFPMRVVRKIKKISKKADWNE